MKRLSKDFYIVMAVVLAFFMFFLLSIPAKKAMNRIFQKDSRIIKRYYNALDKKNFKVAYGSLADLTLKYKVPEGEPLEFNVRPDYGQFVKDNEKLQSIKVLSVIMEDKHCFPEVGLRCFRVEAVIKYRDLVVDPRGKTTLYIYTLNTGREPLILGIRTTP